MEAITDSGLLLPNPNTLVTTNSNRVVITDMERAIGNETFDYFKKRVKRRLPWEVTEGHILIPRRDGTFEDLTPGIQAEGKIIPLPVIMTLRRFKNIEDDLKDFGPELLDITRNYRGINRAAHQWLVEEGQHSDGSEVILLASGLFSDDELKAGYNKNLEYRWRAPFRTIRRMNAFALIQEYHTMDDYRLLAVKCEEVGAVTTGRAIRRFSADEGRHHSTYMDFIKVFYKYDPKGTVRDLLYVSGLFRMPSEGSIEDPEVENANMLELGFNPRRSARIIKTVLVNTGMVTPIQAAKASRKFVQGLRAAA